MTVDDTVGLLAYLHELYADHFPVPNHAMTKLWCDHMRHVDEDLAHTAAERWARHHTFKGPSLDELLEQVEIVRDEQQRALRRRTSTGTTSYLDVLKEAAEAQASNPVRTPDDATYARLMVILAERSMGTWQDSKGVWRDKLTHEQRGEQCYGWAKHYEATRPDLARDLCVAARKFAETLYVPTQ